MWKSYKNFWTKARVKKANEIGLNPNRVIILASVVQKESQKEDERPKVAGVYINRLNRNMKLQADPTIIYALKLKYENSKDYFLSLVSQFPDHWRSPLAHKKIGDVYLSQGLNDEAKEKYQYVANSYPENTAASLALQILENME